jgi:hypothetical protein
MITKNGIVYIWVILYSLLLCFIVVQYSSFVADRNVDETMLSSTLLGSQKMLFNNILVFSIFLYITRRDYLVSEYAVRKRKFLSLSMLFHGIQKSAIYTVITFAVYLTILTVLGYNIHTIPILYIIKLFFFCLAAYLYYAVIYTKTANHVVALFVAMLLHLVYLVMLFLVQFDFRVDDINHLLYWNRLLPLLTINVIGVLLLLLSIRKRDFL